MPARPRTAVDRARSAREGAAADAGPFPGLRGPETLMTNDPDELLDFYRIHNGKVVTKAAAVRVDPLVRGGYCGYTRRLHPRDLIAAHDVSLCPVTAQVYVEKRLELRVTIVGADLFAAEIHSQSTRQTRVDWRHYDDRYTVHQAHELPPRRSSMRNW